MNYRWMIQGLMLICFTAFLLPAYPVVVKSPSAKRPGGSRSAAVRRKSQVMLIRLLSRTGSHFQKNVFGLQAGPDLIAVRLVSGLNLQDVWVDNRPTLAIDSTIQLRLREADFGSGWILFQSDRPFSNRTGVVLGGDKAAQVFGHVDLSVIAGGFLARRHIASMGRSESEIVSSQLQVASERLAQSFETAKTRLIVDRHLLAPLATGMRCQAGQPRMNQAELQKFVGSVEGIQCGLDRPLELGRDVYQDLQIQSGALGFVHSQMADHQRWDVLHNLANSTMKGFGELSADIIHSTATHCESVEIAESQSDIYFCTHGLRPFSDLNDSFLFMGRQTGGKYVYSLVRASGFSSQATQRVFQHLIRTGEKSP